jgi:hypothetical protein
LEAEGEKLGWCPQISKCFLDPGIDNLVAYYKRPLVGKNGPMKIKEDLKSGEKDPGAPAGIRTPDIHIIVRAGR